MILNVMQSKASLEAQRPESWNLVLARRKRDIEHPAALSGLGLLTEFLVLEDLRVQHRHETNKNMTMAESMTEKITTILTLML